LTKNRIRVEINGDEVEVEAPFLIAADGVSSRVREQVCQDRVPAVPLLQAEIDLPAGWDQRLTKVWFDTNKTSYFFWLIPDHGGKAVLGLIAHPGENIIALLKDFASDRDFVLGKYQSGTAAYYSRFLRNEIKADDIRILFAGDAAGQVKVTTVGGTVTGLMGGLAAARAVSSGTGYQAELRAVKRELDLHLFIRDLMAKMSGPDYQYLVGAVSSPVREFLSKHDRDRMRNHFWKLAILQPAFIPLGGKLLLRYIADQLRK
jgi:flavin-dependent dehydrogenase